MKDRRPTSGGRPKLDDWVRQVLENARLPVDLSWSSSRGRHALAKTNLDPGTVVIVERGVAVIPTSAGLSLICSHCFKELPADSVRGDDSLTNGKFHCLHFYCSSQCRDADVDGHQVECRLMPTMRDISLDEDVDLDLLRLVARLVARRHIGERAQSETSRAWNPLFENTPFPLVTSLLSHRKYANIKWIKTVSAASAKLSPPLAAEVGRPVNPDLLLTLSCVINSNAHGLGDTRTVQGHSSFYDRMSSQSAGPMGVGGGLTTAFGLFPLGALLNHSCEPNCVYGAGQDGTIVFRTIKEVKEGEELLVSYIPLDDPLPVRRGVLLTTKHFWCECSRCGGSEERLSAEFRRNAGILCPRGKLCNQCETNGEGDNHHSNEDGDRSDGVVPSVAACPGFLGPSKSSTVAYETVYSDIVSLLLPASAFTTSSGSSELECTACGYTVDSTTLGPVLYPIASSFALAVDLSSTDPTYANLRFQESAWMRVLKHADGVLDKGNWTVRKAEQEMVGVCVGLADLEAAVWWAKRVVRSYDEDLGHVYGRWHPDMAEWLIVLGELERAFAHYLRSQNRPYEHVFKSSLKHFRRAADIYRTIYGADADLFPSLGEDGRIAAATRAVNEVEQEIC
ncbi:SET domain-containing protein [Gonapodya prolifera JEL478]|uniref:SET domain-containing protein n=1 Tax=Gonapodya prolifera (strain JEL478) TaxID=1344416 RepID=A0A139A8D8_GONPJ|nr:SET domain-containing protein [Gonapodya prolifera JEL478]|eukprot:KXS12948.1 SET domain-containing protein [Gonapodya prolifera JEL478]